MASKNWMQSVSKNIKAKGHSGVFREAAERAGKSTHEYAEEKKHASGKTGQRARLALAFASAKHG
jgi:hypothetical protein